MAISILFGPGGSGKSMYQMHIIIRELRFSKRNICTNMALNVPEFQQYLQDTYPNENLDLTSRLKILSVDETYEFWKYRGPDRIVFDEHEGDVFTFISDKGINGVAFVIDEAGAAGFNAIGWMQQQGAGKRGERCMWYLDQQRKFGDNVYASTNGRFPHGIAKPFRDRAHDFTRLSNGLTSRLGMFRGMAQFKRKHYTQEPGPNVEPYEQGTFPMDWKGIGSCYRTQDGVGIVGHQADKGTKGRGIPVVWVFPMMLAAGLACVFIPFLFGHYSGKFIASKTEVVRKMGSEITTPALTAKPEKPKGVSVPLGVFVAPRVITPEAPAVEPPKPESDGGVANKPFITGYLVSKSGAVSVIMSDGTFVTEDDTRIRIKRGRVLLGQGNDGWKTPLPSLRGGGNYFPEQSGGENFLQNRNKFILDNSKGSVTVGRVKSYDGVTKPQNQNQNDNVKENTNRGDSVSGLASSVQSDLRAAERQDASGS